MKTHSIRGPLLVLLAAAACHRQPAATVPAPVPTPTPRPVPTISSGEGVVRAMHDRYVNRWYRTVTFTQRTTVVLPSGGDLVQTWYEAALLPGRLRIDTDLKTRTGTLFNRDSVFTFSSGKLASADTGVNELLLLGFDVYAEPTNRTISDLRRRGFDLDVFHEGMWQGKPVYVVGAARGDTMSKQFWVDRDSLLFVRLIERARQGRSDVRFNQYVKTGGGWIATQVVQLVNGRRRLMEEYSDIRPNVALADGLFDPRQWTTAAHWSRPAP